MRSADIIIIGGGVVGASIAYHLTERGQKDVLILERESELGRGSTGKATGGVRAQFETEINICLSLESIEFFSNFEELTGVDCGYDPKGYVFLATGSEHLDFLRCSGERQRSLGYSEVTLVSPNEIAEIVPGLNVSDVVGGSFGPRDGFIDPLGVLEGFSARAVANGARIGTNSEVLAIESGGGKVRGVKTSAGFLETDTVILCAGAWASKLAATAGIDLPVQPLRRQIVWAGCRMELPSNLPMVIDLSDGFHFRPVRNSRSEVLFAFPEKDTGAGFDTEFQEVFIEQVYRKAEHRAPFLCASEVVRDRCRAGLYENSPDHHAIIGGCDLEGLYFANGFSGHGVMHSPAVGKAVAEIVLDGPSSRPDIACLAIERFSTGELLHETAFI